MGKITIADIARQANVSKTTVSHFINGRFDSMSEQTRESIEEIVRKANYYPASAARTLKSRKSNLVGFIVQITQTSTIISRLISGICKRLNENGYTPLIFESVPDGEIKNLQNCLSHNPEGLIVSPSSLDLSPYLEAASTGLPVVLVDRYRPGWPYDAVYINHYHMVQQTLRHLKQQGFERIALINREYGPASTLAFRTQAYEEFMQAEYPDVERAIYHIGERNEKRLPRILEEIAHSGKAPAVVVADGELLGDVLECVRQLGLTMPDDIGICGYDNWNWARLHTPGVTGLDQYRPAYEMGIKTVDLLTKRMRGSKDKPQVVVMEGSLTVRESTLRKTTGKKNKTR